MQLALSQNDKKLCAKVAAFDVRASLFFFSGGNSCVPSVASEQVRAANSRFFFSAELQIRQNSRWVASNYRLGTEIRINDGT